MKLISTLALTLGAYLTPASAALISTTANLTEAALPADVTEGSVESDLTAFIFLEATDLTLTADLDFNLAAGETYTQTMANVPGPPPSTSPIASGTLVDIWLVHFDGWGLGHPDDTNNGATDILRSIVATFDTDVLGVITDVNLLADSDLLFAGNGTTYAGATGLRGTLDSNNDTVTVNTQSVDFGMAAGTNFIDQLRIVVASAQQPPVDVPEPSSLPLLLLGGLLLGLTTRKIRKS